MLFFVSVVWRAGHVAVRVGDLRLGHCVKESDAYNYNMRR